MLRQLIIALLSLLLLSPHVVSALSWNSKSNSLVVSANNAPNRAVDALQQAIGARASVKDWMKAVSSSKTAFDCSESSLKAWSDNCEALAESSHARAEMAAALTMCETKSATSTNVPKECLDWSDAAGTAGPCIESPQHWSSYTSLLRDIVQTCHAFQKWHDSASIKRLYANMSSIQNEFMQQIFSYETQRQQEEKQADLRRSRWQDQAESTMSSMASSVESFTSLFRDYRDLSDQMASQRESEKKEQEIARANLQNVHVELKRTSDQLPSMLQSVVQAHARDIASGAQELVQHTASQFYDAFDRILGVHANGLAKVHEIQLQRSGEYLATLDTGMLALSSELTRAGLVLREHHTQLDAAGEVGSSLSSTLLILQRVLHETGEAAERNHIMQHQAFLQQMQMTASLANATTEVEERIRGLHVSTFPVQQALGLIGLAPSIWKIVGRATLSTLRKASFVAGVALIVLSNPYFVFLSIPATLFNFIRHYRRSKADAIHPWRTTTGRKFLSSV